MKRLLWGRSARQDIDRIADHYGQFDVDLPQRLIDRIERAPLILATYPDLGSPTASRGLRKWPVRRTPFVLLYRVVGDDVQIRRVIDARSDMSRIVG